MSFVTRQVMCGFSLDHPSMWDATEVSAMLWTWRGFRLMTHPVVKFGSESWRVSEETTGFGIPDSHAPDPYTAKSRAISRLRRSERAFHKELSDIRQKLSEPATQPAPSEKEV